MVRIKRLMATALIPVLAACASPRGAATSGGEAGASGENWACRSLHQGGPSRQSGYANDLEPPGNHGDAGTVAGVLVVWPLLTGICLASRI